MKLLHQCLKKLREDRRLTMREVAEAIGVPLTTYREWEYGRAVRASHLLKLTKFFGVSLEELSGRDSELSLEERLNRAVNDIEFVKSELTRHTKK